MNENNLILTRVFTRTTLKSLCSSEQDYATLRSVVRRYNITHDEGTHNGEIISEIYQYINKHCRYEYYYKNTLLNKLIINSHRINTTVALTEIPISKSKADFIMINGKAMVYEIKTELDTFERLENQIADYYKAFDHVCVVTSEEQADELFPLLKDTPTGIYILTKRNTIKKLKEPKEYACKLEKDCIFKILNKPEYESLVMQIQGALPNVTPVNYYRECKRIVCDLPIETLYPMFLKELKKRNRIEINSFDNVPPALNFLIYFSKLQKGELKNLQNVLTKSFEMR